MIKDGNVYRPIKDNETAAETIDVDAQGKATIVGLAGTTYYLQEEVAPAGYAKLTARIAAAASADTSTTAVDYKIPNEKGQELPETGGIGTTIFYILGALLVIGCGIVLVARRRITAK